MVVKSCSISQKIAENIPNESSPKGILQTGIKNRFPFKTQQPALVCSCFASLCVGIPKLSQVFLIYP